MKPWMEEWDTDNDSSCREVLFTKSYPTHRGRFAQFNGAAFDRGDEPSEAQVARAELAAAAPAMARALCLAETSYGEGDYYCTAYQSCGVCAKPIAYTIEDGKHVAIIQHKPACPLDAALTAAGLSPEDREQVRKAMR